METLAPQRARATDRARLDHALARLSKVSSLAAARAGAALSLTLEGVEKSIWPEVAWSASSLTDDGFPVELSWSSRSRAVRWTAEAVGPEVAEADRLFQVMRRFEQLSGHELGHDLSGGESRKFGAWLGGRHEEGGEDRYKIYAEYAAPLPAWSGALAAAEGDLGRRLRLRMVGAEARGPLELYARAEGLDRLALRRFFGAQFGRLEPILTVLAGDRTPHTGGVSLGLMDGEVVARFWFAPAQLVCGGEGRVSDRLQAAAKILAADTQLYRALDGRHGMIGLGVTATGEIRLQVGVRPASSRT